VVPAGRFSSRRRLIIALAAAAVLAAALIGAGLLTGGGGKGGAGSGGAVVGGAATAKLLAGIPQQGTTLGSPNAPYTLAEYADLQCPYCGVWARDVLPAVVRDYVRPGNVKIEFRGLAFVGSDSLTALETALGAVSQNRFWNVLDLLFRNQGSENTGWVTDSLVRSVLRAVPGLDAAQVLAERDGSAVTARVSSAAQLAALAAVNSTPTFELGLTGGSLQRLDFGSLDVSSFTAALDAAMSG
jgi:protein-disulfide isomerase